MSKFTITAQILSGAYSKNLSQLTFNHHVTAEQTPPPTPVSRYKGIIALFP